MTVDLDTASQAVIPNLSIKDKKQLPRKLRLYHFFILRRVLFPLLTGAFFQLNSSGLEPILALRLQSEDVSQIQIGLFYALTPLFFIIGAIVSQVVKHKF